MVPTASWTAYWKGRRRALPIDKLMPKLTPEQELQAIAMDSMMYAAAGVTTANNGGSPSIDEHFLKASRSGDLKIRVVIWPNGRNAKLIESYGKKRQGTQLDAEGKVVLGPVKLFADGSPQGYTAWFSKPYYKQLPGKPADYRGFPVFKSREELFALVQQLHDGRLADHHAHQRRPGHPGYDRRLFRRVEGQSAQGPSPYPQPLPVLPSPTRWTPLPKWASCPPTSWTHTWFWGDIHRDMVAGPERAAHISPRKAALDKGITFALHKRHPGDAHQPAHGRVLRRDPSDLLRQGAGPGSAHQRSWKPCAASPSTARTCSGWKTRSARWKRASWADLVILDKDPTKVAPETLKDIKVDETIVGGQTVYKRA